MKTALHQRLVMVGDRDGLKELLRRRLVECGWRDQVKLISKELIKEHGHDITYDTLLSAVTTRARTLVPDSVKKELLQKIKNQLMAQEEKLKIVTDR
ncbi:transcription and mRNA export factor ENY2 [Anoplolepis gracilipes]|uniref:transcription and mRNA export factor ENY2 n=1 Tax=Anoplolepis gracilipes TaxID=354296 RepID=UPI003B9E51C6